METKQTRSGDTLVIALSGRLDATSAEPFQQQLLRSIESGETAILLDLLELEYVSSAGLRALLVAARHLQDKGGRLKACSASGEVREVLQMTGFDSFVPVLADREAALADPGARSSD